jgi:quinol monooxygenase YgiN
MQFLIRAYDGEGKLDELLLTEVWRDAEAIEVHKNSVHFAKLGELKAEYVENTEFMKFSAEQV